MHINDVVWSLKFDGFWYTYHTMTSMPYDDNRMDALWKIWVAWHHTRYKNPKIVWRNV